MNKSIKGFSLVEIITTTAIIAVLAIVGFTFASNYQSNQYNTSRVADLTAIYNLFQTSYTQNKTFPDPSGNKQYYDRKGTYAHGRAGAFGVSGFLTQKTLSKDKVGYPFKDEQTKNYYAFGKRLDGNSGYNIATVLNQKGEYFSYVVGDIGGNRMELAGLVKEYAGPNFVTNKSKYLPYNPYEIKLTGKISVYSGAVTIVDSNSETIASPNILDYEIEKGDTVKVPAGGIAIINLSDGTELRLGSTSGDSELDFSELEYTDDSNLFTKVMLNLSLGEIWVKAPELEKESAFELKNRFLAATVRGTVFGMTTNASSGSVSLIDGKLEVGKVSDNSAVFSNSTGSGFSVVDGVGFMEVAPGEKPIYLNVTDIANPTFSGTGNVGTGKVLEIETPVLKFNSGMLPNLISITRTTPGILGIKVENIGATSIEIKGTGKEQEDYYSGTFLATDQYFNKTDITWPHGSNNYAIRLCVDIVEENKNCTGRAIQNTSGTSMSEASVINFKRNSVGTKLVCETGKKSFAGFGCQDENLIAYAPYDNIGDLYMYTASPTVGSGRLEPRTNAVAGNNYYKVENYLKIDGTNSDNNGLDYFAPNTTISSGTVNMFDINSSFMSMVSGDRGVVVNGGNSAYMKYDLSKLNLGDSFSIEMSVRGGALGRENNGSNGYYLFQTNDGFKLQKYVYGGTQHALTFGIGLNPAIKYITFNPDTLVNNDFYKVIVKFSGNPVNSGNVTIKIIDKNNANIGIESPYTATGILNLQDIYIGSTNTSTLQWNDIIDYVKIYNN